MVPEVINPDKHAAIITLQNMMAQMPQVHLETEHFFADGMYCRLLARPAGTLIVGKVHKKEHLYIVCSGTVQVTDGDRPAESVTGPRVFVSHPGAKRAVLAITDAVCLTVHRTEKTDLDEIEADLVERDDCALFDARNELRRIEQ